mgnify:CR=1 FL=1
MQPITVRMTLACLIAIALTGCHRRKANIEKVDDIYDARVGVLLGSMGEALAKQRFPKAEVKCFDEIPDAISAVAAGQLDAVITTQPAANLATSRHPRLRLLPQMLDDEETCLGLRLTDHEMLENINRILDELMADGTIGQLNGQWLTGGDPAKDIEIPVSESGTPLKVGICSLREPFTFKDPAGEVIGHNAVLARIVAGKLGRPIEFVDLKFAALIAALQTGKIDMIATGMSASEERRKQIAFSKPYYMNHQMVIVRSGPGSDQGAKPAILEKEIGRAHV